MKSALFLACIAGVTVGVAQDPDPRELARLRANYRTQIETVTKPLRDAYSRELEALEKSLTLKGDLNGALAVRREREQILAQSTNPLGLPKQPPPQPAAATADATDVSQEYQTRRANLEEKAIAWDRKKKELEAEVQKQLSNPLNRSNNRLKSLNEVRLEKEAAACLEKVDKARLELREIVVRMRRDGIPIPE